MDFSILNQASAPIPLHAYAAMLAIVLGAIQFMLPKGGIRHKILGYAWMLCLGAVAISSFFIHEIRLIGPFCPIHLLSVLTLWGIYTSIASARRGDIKAHKRSNIQIYCLALILTGAFTLLPGRIMYRVLFGG